MKCKNKNCNNEHNGGFGSGLFCSRACANSREWSEDDKKKKSESAKKSEKCKILYKKLEEIKLNKNPIVKECICISCGKLFSVNVKLECEIPRKTCSKECLSKATGGYREGSGRSKHGYYKGIYCGSTYELVWVIYQLDHNLPCERFPSYLEGEGIKYYPDFFDKNSNTIIEIKGFEDLESVNKKIHLSNLKGYNIIILRKEDLQKEFDWVKNNYSYKKIFELYDNYKPKYNYKCSFCDKDVSRNYKQKTSILFCSRSCAGRFRSKQNIKKRFLSI